MNRRQFLFTVAGTLLTSVAFAGTVMARQKPDPPRKSTPQEAVVLDYIRARKARQWDQAHVLLSQATQQMIPMALFSQSKTLPADPTSDGMTPILTAISTLFIDPDNSLGYQYTVIGSAPRDPNTVLVDARPPADASKKPLDSNNTLHLKIVIVGEPSAGQPHIDMMKSMQQSDPDGCKRAADWATSRNKR